MKIVGTLKRGCEIHNRWLRNNKRYGTICDVVFRLHGAVYYTDDLIPNQYDRIKDHVDMEFEMTSVEVTPEKAAETVDEIEESTKRPRGRPPRLVKE